MSLEVWRPVVGYEGLYEVSNRGRVKSCDRIVYFINGKHKSYKSCLKSLQTNMGGYSVVSLSKNGKKRSLSVHRIVAEAFLGPCHSLLEVNHKDEDKTNNHVENLEYCTPSYNSNYGTRGERISRSQEKPVESIDEFGRVKWYSSLREAAIEEHVLRQDISHCVRGKRHTCGGFAWRYAAEIEHYGLQGCEKVEVKDHD